MVRKHVGRIVTTVIAFLLLTTLLLSAVGCTSADEKISDLESQLNASNAKIQELESQLKDSTDKINTLEQELAYTNQYDFYITLGTMPTLYATLNAYAVKNPNTYMWFYRGNTISKQYSADFIHYLPTQSNDNNYSVVDYALIREKVKDILEENPDARFHLYCDDLRVQFIADIFVAAGVEFEDMQVTLLSDGTGTYQYFHNLTDEDYAKHAKSWEDTLKLFADGRNDPDFVSPYPNNGQAMELMMLSFYVSTFDNVEFWVQNPQYLTTSASTVMQAKETMHIIAKDPKEMYRNLNEKTRKAYQEVVLANALVGSDTLNTLEDAANYFDSMLANRDREVVLILGTSRDTLAGNQFYIDETLAFYTPTLSAENNTVVRYKGKEYTVAEGAETVEVDGKTLTIGELGVYLFFKGHPAYPAKEDLQEYFDENGIVVLPHRTPVETLFWMYDVKVGGYNSTSFLSCTQGQTEFFYENPTSEALIQMAEAGFFEGAVIFQKSAE